MPRRNSNEGTIIPKKSNSDVNISNNELDANIIFPEGGFRVYVIVLGSLIGLIGCLGFVNTCGIVETHIKHHILAETEPKNIAWIFSIYNFMTFGCSIIVGPIFDRIGSKPILVFGSIILTLGIMLSSISIELYQFIIFYGILAGMGTSFVLTPLVGVISHWFFKKRALNLGIAFMGGGIGGAIFPIMLRYLFSRLGFGWSIRIYGFVVLCLMLVALLLTTDRCDELNTSKSNNLRELSKQIITSVDFKYFKERVYLTLVIGWLGNELPYILTLTFLSSYAVANGYSEYDAFLLIIVLNGCSIPGRFLPGYLADKFGCFNMMCLISLLSTVAFFVIWLPAPAFSTLGGLYAFSSIYGFISGSSLSLAPACIGQISKTRDFGKRYGTAYFILSVLDLVGIALAGVILDNRIKNKGFENLVIFISLISFMGTCFSLLSRYFYCGFKKLRV